MNIAAKHFLIGGTVRDLLVGRKPHDFDFAVEATSYEAMRRSIIAREYEIKHEKPEFVTIKAKHPEYGVVDFVLCRKEGAYRDGRHPDFVEVGTLHDDQKRRDFTMNSIAQTEDGLIIDPFDGQADIQRKLIRCVGDTLTRMREDRLRLLRAVRFHITLGFDLHPDICDALDSLPIEGISTERVREELNKCFEHDTLATLEALQNFPLVAAQCFKDEKLKLKPTLLK